MAATDWLSSECNLSPNDFLRRCFSPTTSPCRFPSPSNIFYWTVISVTRSSTVAPASTRSASSLFSRYILTRPRSHRSLQPTFSDAIAGSKSACPVRDVFHTAALIDSNPTCRSDCPSNISGLDFDVGLRQTFAQSKNPSGEFSLRCALAAPPKNSHRCSHVSFQIHHTLRPSAFPAFPRRRLQRALPVRPILPFLRRR